MFNAFILCISKKTHPDTSVTREFPVLHSPTKNKKKNKKKNGTFDKNVMLTSEALLWQAKLRHFLLNCAII